jgi:hypothetical protein
LQVFHNPNSGHIAASFLPALQTAEISTSLIDCVRRSNAALETTGFFKSQMKVEFFGDFALTPPFCE